MSPLPPGHFHGRPQRSRQAAGLLLTERVYTAGTVLARHAHARPYLRLVRQGAVTESDGRRVRVCPPLSVVFRSAHEEHSEVMRGEGARSLIVEFAPEWLDRVGHHADALCSGGFFADGPVPVLALRLHRELLDWDELSPIAAEGLALELLAAASRRAPRDEPRRAAWLSAAAEVIQTRFMEPLSLTGLARAVGVHPVHLARSFRHVHACTVGEYLRRMRVGFAEKEMASSDAPLSDIALRAGFCDQSHFSRTFKRLTGSTPAVWRAAIRRR